MAKLEHKTIILIFSHMDSARIKGKSLLTFDGKTILEHIIERCKMTGLESLICVPKEQMEHYYGVAERTALKIFGGSYSPLHRANEACIKSKADSVIRITHDKIFVDPEEIQWVSSLIKSNTWSYIKHFGAAPGCGFEIIHKDILSVASYLSDHCEHLTYACEDLCKNKLLIKKDYNHDIRLLIDHKEDVELMEYIFSNYKGLKRPRDIIKWLRENKAFTKNIMHNIPKHRSHDWGSKR